MRSLAKKSSLMRVDDVLTICPEDGVLHDVRQSDSLESIATLYGIPEEDIIAYPNNNLEFPYRLYPETQVFVPGAVREVFVWTPPDPPSNRGSELSRRLRLRRPGDPDLHLAGDAAQFLPIL